MSPSYISRVTPPTFVIVPRPPSSCHPRTSHVSPRPSSLLYHAHLPRVTLTHPTCRSARFHHCTTPTFLVSPSYIPRVARPTFTIVPRPSSSCHPHISRVARPTFIIVPRPPSSCHPHISRVAWPTFIIVPRPPFSCHTHIPRVARLRHRLYRPISQDQSSHLRNL